MCSRVDECYAVRVPDGHKNSEGLEWSPVESSGAGPGKRECLCASESESAADDVTASERCETLFAGGITMERNGHIWLPTVQASGLAKC